MIESVSTISYLFTGISTLLTSIILWKLKSQGEKNEHFAAAIIALENTAVNEEHVRKILKEELQTMNTVLPELSRSMNEMKQYISEEKGYRAGLAAGQRRQAQPTVAVNTDRE